MFPCFIQNEKVKQYPNQLDSRQRPLVWSSFNPPKLFTSFPCRSGGCQRFQRLIPYIFLFIHLSFVVCSFGFQTAITLTINQKQESDVVFLSSSLLSVDSICPEYAMQRVPNGTQHRLDLCGTYRYIYTISSRCTRRYQELSLSASNRICFHFGDFIGGRFDFRALLLLC